MGLKVIGAGICLSPAYITSFELEQTFRNIVQDYNINYLKGDRTEGVSRQILPPYRKKTKMNVTLSLDNEGLNPNTAFYLSKLDKELSQTNGQEETRLP